MWITVLFYEGKRHVQSFVPREVFLTRGVGKHKHRLSSFEEALRQAGVANQNLVSVSSILPPGCKVISRKEGVAKLGYFYLPRYWGKGYATEAMKAVLQFAFETLGLHKIITGCLKENSRSERVMIKCGMRKEAELLQHVRHEGKWKDRLEYGLLKDQWEINQNDTGFVSGVNHITLSVRDIDVAFTFYKEILMLKPIQTSQKSAYLVAGNIWIALHLDSSANEDTGKVVHTIIEHILTVP